MNRVTTRAVLAVLGLALVTLRIDAAPAADPAAAPSGGALKPGDPAPRIKVAKWLKGEPVESFQPGRVYVVEFWATWCGPCRQAIPHLTELAKKHRDRVTIIGMNVWEDRDAQDDAYVQTVADFVARSGDEMGYTVAVDVRDGATARAWMDAAGLGGIPASFVVGGNGRIAWIGHPTGGLGKVLADVVTGRFDVKAAAADHQPGKRVVDEVVKASVEKAADLLAKKRPAEALAELDALIRARPGIESSLGFFRFTILLQADEAEAYRYARTLIDRHLKDDANMLRAIADTMMRGGGGARAPDYALAVAAAQRAAEVSRWQNPYVIDSLAKAHAKNGNAAEALRVGRVALEVVEKLPSAPASAKDEIRANVAAFEKQAAGK